MSNGFSSYSTFVAPVEPTGPPPSQVRVHDTVTRVSSTDGQVTETSTRTHEQGHTGEINPWHGTDSFAATARSANGSPVTELSLATLVTIGGVQASVAFFVAEGILQKHADGTFGEATGKPEKAPVADSGDFLPLGNEAMVSVNAALAEVDQGNLDSLMASGTGVAIGRLDAASLAQRFGQVSGHGAEESRARVATIATAFQAQADTALQGMGVAGSDLQAFYSYCRTNHQAELQQAVSLQMRTHAIAGYRDLAAKWQSSVPPSLNALRAAGLSVRSQGTGSEVFLAGSWMTPAAAAKAGLI